MPLDTETGNPAPLGLVGFGLTTVLLSTINAGLLPAAGEVVVIPLALTFGGTAQLVAGVLEFRTGNTFGQTAFFSYGAFWWWFGLLLIFSENGWISLEGATTALGFALILWGVFTFYMWISTFKLNWGLWAVFLTLWITFALLGFGDLLGIELPRRARRLRRDPHRRARDVRQFRRGGELVVRSHGGPARRRADKR